jgi:hypothetical protein
VAMNRPARHGDKSTRQSKRERLIIAMLQQPDLEKAAASVGISKSTAYRIRKTPEFQTEYLQARRDTVSQAVARIQQGCAPAATTLLKIMLDPKSPPACKLRAAERVMEHGLKSLEWEDFELRLRRLEQQVAEAESERPR